ncbi:tripartite tricarboxylate transporter substrate binding protein [Lampropedia puyangensis]|uniref:Tripartite tricarboxylate transporter substrate binding protein n=1 Tax=Lampropedia puyangensis TaxID=1330072 RepID=A0A4S8FDB3_9BURK|nr:tripartite tricarboxylate transporter substrate binding protein [Lampropedia puyangensis]THU05289.1 tripartite tricarboxylate transporter substrate binding protein [Lampropedia puyangensis]
MRIQRRTWLTGTLGAALLLATQTAFSNGWPTQPIRLLVPFAPGGAVDQTARTINETLGKHLGQTVVVENKPGASGSLAAADLARAKPDGYTLMLALDSQAVNHHTIANLRFDTFTSFDYLSLLVTTPQVLVVRENLPVQSVQELVDYIKSKPGLAYGSAGAASAGHVNSATLSDHYKLQTTHVPYRGAGPLLADLMGEHVDFAFAGLSVMLPHIQSGRIRALAVSSPQRATALPNIPTMSEIIPGFEIPTWIGLVAPAGLPEDVRQKILSATKATMQDPKVAQKLRDSAFDIVNNAPDAFSARVRKDSDVMADLIARKVLAPE